MKEKSLEKSQKNLSSAELSSKNGWRNFSNKKRNKAMRKLGITKRKGEQKRE
jgi:hypothetical protein